MLKGLFVVGLVGSSAMASSLQLSVDKGSVYLVPDSTIKYEARYQIETKPKSNCKSEVVVNESVSGSPGEVVVNVRHIDPNSCPEGVVTTFRFNPAYSLDVRLGGGYVEFQQTASVLKQDTAVQAVTKGGIVQSAVPAIQVSAGYAPATASYGSFGTATRKYSIAVLGGMIQFR